MKRRQMLAMTGAVAGGALLRPRLARAQTPVHLWHVFHLETEYYMREGVRTFNEAHPDLLIEERIIPSAQYQPEFVRAVATGTTPDVICIDNPDNAYFANEGALRDISDFLGASEVIKAESYRENSWSTTLWRDAHFGIPRDSNTIGIYYNKEMFEAAGLDPESPPSSWSELVAAATALTDPASRVFGLVFASRQWEDSVFQWLPFVWQAGGDIDRLAGPEAREALQLWVDFLRTGVTTQDVLTMTQSDAVSRFIAGNSAMAISGPWDTPRVAENATFDWAVALMPEKDGRGVRASALGGWNWCIPAAAQNPEAGWQLIEWMARPELMATSWRAGRLPPRVDVAIESEEYPQARDTYLKQLADARPRGPHPQWPEISRFIQLAIQQAMTGQSDVATALETAAAGVDGILSVTPL